MANLIIPEGYGQVSIRLQHSLVLRAAAVTFGVRVDGSGPTLADSPDIVTDAFAGRMASRLDQNVTIGPATTTIQLPDGTYASYVGTETDQGTASSSTPPPNVALLCQKVTNRPGRRGRGRMYLPWAMDDTGVDEAGAVDPAVVNATAGALNGLLDDLLAASLPMYLLHAEGESTAGEPNSVSSWQVAPFVATQRRRMRP